MIPIIYAPANRTFDTMGLGTLPDCLSCSVTEVLNGAYDLDLVCAADGPRSEWLKPDYIVYAPHDESNELQPFRIYSVERTLDRRVTVKAHHVSYALNHTWCSPFAAGTLVYALNQLKAHMDPDSPFTFWTTRVVQASYTQVTPATVRERLGGVRGSILDVYGGQYEWDHFKVTSHARRGADNGVTIAYGKDLTALSLLTDDSSLVTKIYPYWYRDDTLVEIPNKVIGTTIPSTLSYHRTRALDMTDKFETQPTPARLNTAARSWLMANAVTEPVASVSAEYYPLWQAAGYEGLEHLARVHLGDTIRVDCRDLGVDVTTNVTGLTYDVLGERYTGVTIGVRRGSLSTMLADMARR